MYPIHNDCLYMQPCRTRKKRGKSALYTEEMRYLRRFVQLMHAAGYQACRPPIAYRTHSNTLQRLSVATGVSSVQIHAQEFG
jgi:hypothetical protein